ncbi:hypothetical protein [Nocardia veterana]|uniref:Uncharacterized protein n=1 Tax=Nocardia veterana TaxID=132249 RepID=A0A7X6LZR3_9NOCA|nr:hypothetical protein [Nocardia veterana]NKY87557.1 hypothetical protein [Nocardia veterana]
MTATEDARGVAGRRPVAPNAAQKALLRRLCAVAAQTRVLLDAARNDYETGALAEPAWFARLDALMARGAALAELGHAGGISQRWIDLARARGERGTRWRAPQRWPVPQPVQRDRLINDLATEARDLTDVVAVHAAYRARARSDEPESLRTRIEATAALRYERLTSIAALLDLIGPERDRIRPGPDAIWARALAATVRDRALTQLAQQWRAHAHHEPASVRAYRLLRDHGDIDFTPDSVIAPIPEAMVEHIAAALRLPPGLAAPVPPPPLPLGAHTDSAVAAALGEPRCLKFPAPTAGNERHVGGAPAPAHRDNGPSP